VGRFPLYGFMPRGSASIIYGLVRKDGFDPFPFQLLTLIVSLEAIFLSTFILISQNRDMQLAERRNHLDLQINLLTDRKIRRC
jgi:uncharacterized membrane protein